MTTFVTLEQIDEAADAIRKRISHRPRIGMILGSGLNSLADSVQNAQILPYRELPHWPVSTVHGHAGQLVIGELEGQPVLVMQGRIHFYEGYSMSQITLPVRVMQRLRLEMMFVTNAAGGVNPEFVPGDVMLISDHLNLMGDNPLRGSNDERFGPRFPDMSAVYAPELQEMVVEEAKAIGTEVRRGIYGALSGPSYETPAEIHLLRGLGADAVGMSTVPEAIVARHMGMEVLGISCITNMAAGISDEPINHEEVMATGDRVREIFALLLRRVVERIHARV